jgi:hypothetical protein
VLGSGFAFGQGVSELSDIIREKRRATKVKHVGRDDGEDHGSHAAAFVSPSTVSIKQVMSLSANSRADSSPWCRSSNLKPA